MLVRWDVSLALCCTLQQGLSLQKVSPAPLFPAHLKFGFKAKELREQAVVLEVACPWWPPGSGGAGSV